MKDKSKLFTLPFNINYENLFNSIPYAVCISDINHKYVYVNDKSYDLYKGDIDNLLYKTPFESIGMYYGGKCIRSNNIVFNSKTSQSFIEHILHNGIYKSFKIIKTPIFDINNNVIGIFSIAKDLSEVEIKEAQLNNLMENLPLQIWISDTKGNITLANKALAASLNKPLNEILGENLSTIFDKSLHEEIDRENQCIIKSKMPLKILRSTIENNEMKHYEIHKNPILGAYNNVIGLVGTIVDVSDITNAKNEIEHQTFIDFQTNLYNRRGLYATLKLNSSHHNLTSIIIDIDNFKYINDIYGHDIGDDAILAIANIIKELFLEDIIFRYGGDEFLILSKRFNNNDEITYLCNKLLQRVNTLKLNNNFSIELGLSIGIFTCNNSCKQKSFKRNKCLLLKKSDIALYKAKECGKNQYKFYDESFEDEFNKSITMELMLKHAMLTSGFYLQYQPQYTTEKKLKGFEALLRWSDEELISIPILETIDILEKNKLIIPLGYEIIRKAFKFSTEINKVSDTSLMVSINISPIQITSDNFISHVKTLIEETKVNPNNICFEITETSLLKNIDVCINIVESFKELGINLSIDDFGVGYCSLSYFMSLPIDILKIDKSFINEIHISPKHAAIGKLIIDTAKLLNITTVAEGVEINEQLSVLKDLNVDYIQGYLYSKPLLEKEALDLIANRYYK